MEENLIKYQIKGREITYYLTSEEDLQNIKSKNLLADVFVLLFSISMGGTISTLLTKESSQTDQNLTTLLVVFISAAVLTGLFSVYFYYTSFKVISKIIKSGEIKTFDNQATAKLSQNELQIVAALYWTPRNSVDVTNKIKDSVIENKLKLLVNNDLVENQDPEWGVVKKLTLTYRINGVLFQREYTELDTIEIP